jgi:hypothetical protein
MKLRTLSTIFLIAAVFFTSTGSLAEARGPCANLHSFSLEFYTGNDDLRTSSEVNVWLKTKSGDVQMQKI